MPRKKGKAKTAYHHQGANARHKPQPVTNEERLRWAVHEVGRLSALARSHPDDSSYKLAAARVEREEVEPIRRAIAAQHRRSE